MVQFYDSVRVSACAFDDISEQSQLMFGVGTFKSVIGGVEEFDGFYGVERLGSDRNKLQFAVQNFNGFDKGKGKEELVQVTDHLIGDLDVF